MEWTRKLERGSWSASALFIWQIPLAAIQAISKNICPAGEPIMGRIERFDITDRKMVPMYHWSEEKTNKSKKDVVIFQKSHSKSEKTGV